MTTSIAFALASSGRASATARAALRLASHATITRSSFKPDFWMYGTTITGRP
jgi:hypothetical protein